MVKYLFNGEVAADKASSKKKHHKKRSSGKMNLASMQRCHASQMLDIVKCYAIFDNIDKLIAGFNQLLMKSKKNPSKFRICFMENNYANYKSKYDPTKRRQEKYAAQQNAFLGKASNDGNSTELKGGRKKDGKKAKRVKSKKQLKKELKISAAIEAQKKKDDEVRYVASLKPDFITNLRYISVYAVVSDAKNSKNRLICEVRLVLRDAWNERKKYYKILETFGHLLDHYSVYESCRSVEMDERSDVKEEHFSWYWSEEIVPKIVGVGRAHGDFGEFSISANAGQELHVHVEKFTKQEKLMGLAPPDA